MKKQILSIVMMFLPMVVWAQGVVEIDGIYYELVSKIKEAKVKRNQVGSTQAMWSSQPQSPTTRQSIA